MKRVLLTTFPAHADALAAQSSLTRSEHCETRVHRDEVEPVLGIDLSGTDEQQADERAVFTRFGLAFAAFLAVGLVLDLLHVVGDLGLPLTMTFGSLGVFAGTLAVLADGARPLDAALREVGNALERGHVLLTVTVDDSASDRVAATVSAHGGNTVYRA